MSSERFKLRAAVYVLLVKDRKVLLSRRFNTGWMDGKYSLVAGHLDGYEKASDAMIREAFEEAGIKINKEDLKFQAAVHHKDTSNEYVDFFFKTEKWEGTPKIMELDKCDDLSWFPVNNLPEKILPHVKDVIEGMQNNISYFEYGW